MSEEVSPVRVLVVSRDESVIEDVRFGFPSDAEVESASDARAAREVLKDFRPSVVIADLMSGSAGGFVVAREMSQMSALIDVPVLILLDRDQDSWLADQAGATMHRTKPLTAESLAADALSLIA
jgi:DNA-binding response OmpR family regulator